MAYQYQKLPFEETYFHTKTGYGSLSGKAGQYTTYSNSQKFLRTQKLER